jgi:hypothetical protein
MELAQGTLQDKLRDKQPSEAEVVDILLQVARGLDPTFRTLSCHREKLRREKIKVSIKINIRSEKRHLRNSKAPKMASKPILNKEQ